MEDNYMSEGHHRVGLIESAPGLVLRTVHTKVVGHELSIGH